MFDRDVTHKKNGQKKPLSHLTHMLTGQQLLAPPQRQRILQRLSHLPLLEPERFTHIGLPLIETVAKNCQDLLSYSRSFAFSASLLLDEVLYRTDTALDLFQSMVQASDTGEFTPAQSLWAYALFSAGLLQDLGRLYTDYAVHLYDQQGACLKKWSPVLETLGSCAPFYDQRLIVSEDRMLPHRVTLLLAHQWMPAGGLAWIASDPDVFATWLALLQDDEEGSGTLGLVLNRAKELSKLRALEKHLERHGHSTPRGGWGDGHPHTNADDVVAAEFLLWLNQALERGDFVLNQEKDVMVTPYGVFVPFEKLKAFAQEHHPHLTNWRALQRAIQSFSGTSHALRNTQSRLENTILATSSARGFLIDSGLIGSAVHVLPTKTQTANKVFGMDVLPILKGSTGLSARLLQLSPEGRWQAPGVVKSATASYGSRHRG